MDLSPELVEQKEKRKLGYLKAIAKMKTFTIIFFADAECKAEIFETLDENNIKFEVIDYEPLKLKIDFSFKL